MISFGMEVMRILMERYVEQCMERGMVMENCLMGG